MKKVGLGEEPAAASKEEEDKELHDDVEQGRRNNNQGSPMKKTSACNQVDPFASTPKPSSGEKQAPALTCNPGAARALTTLLSDLMKHPHLLIAPLLVFCLVAALCSYGIMRATEASYKLEERHARDAANYAADGLAKQLSTACRAVLSLAAVVKMNPSWPFLESNFQVLAKELFRQSYDEGNLSLEELALIPFGRVSLNYGLIHNHTTHTDLFSPDHVNVLGPYRSLAQRGLTLSGPIPLTNTEEKAFAARYPVFFPDTDEDESWGHPDNITHPTDCPGPPCYIPATREKFWGFIGVLVDAKPLQAGKNVHLERLLSDDLSYSLTTSFLAGSNAPGTLVSGGPNADKVTATADVDLPGSSWSLSVYDPRLSDILRLRKGLLALVVIVAFIKAVLLLLLLLSSKRASIYLQEQLVTNKLLQEEKESRETLLNRQLDLIACFEQSTKCTRNLSRSRNVIRRQSTLDQIAAARSAISGMTLSKEEDISVQELLAEGSFGRVYRGKWRAIDVAVKIIMLPGNMSGREKREKMVLWHKLLLIWRCVCQARMPKWLKILIPVEHPPGARRGSVLGYMDLLFARPKKQPCI
uniref:Protein kinase domain-containing protein n=1 Tax=Dunaliella tertiolecta TaxID=3047 RepID=A0A7S3R0U6_DUNTE